MNKITKVIITIVVGLGVLFGAYYLLFVANKNKSNDTPNGISKVVESPITEAPTNPNGNPRNNPQIFDKESINKINPLTKEYFMVYDKACADSKDPVCDIETLFKFVTMEFGATDSQIAIINNEYKDYKELAKKFDFTKGSPILFIAQSIVETQKKQTKEMLKDEKIVANEDNKKMIEETLKNMDIIYPEWGAKNGYYSISLSNWLIDKKNVCDKEDDWKKHETCGALYFIYDEKCPENEYDVCKPVAADYVKNIASARFYFEKVEINSEKGKQLTKGITDEKSYPFLVFKYNEKNFATPFQLIEELKNRGELRKIETNVYYSFPSFFKLDKVWTDSSKICTDDKEKLKDNLYVSCSDKSCQGSNNCLKEEKNKLTMYTMGYCPYCKPVVVKLKEFKEKYPEAKIDIVHLMQANTQIPTQLSDLLSLHGEKETVEWARQYCIAKELWEWTLIEYFTKRFKDTSIKDESNLQEAYKESGITNDMIKKVDTCMELSSTIEELNNRAKEAFKKGIEWTPSYYINNKYKVMGGYNEMLKSYEQYNK